jgi:hypothetical protein
VAIALVSMAVQLMKTTPMPAVKLRRGPGLVEREVVQFVETMEAALPPTVLRARAEGCSWIVRVSTAYYKRMVE